MTPRILSVLAGLMGLIGLASAPAAAAPMGVHPVSLNPPSAEGAPQEVIVLTDLPSTKVVAITLRGGAALAEHTAPVPVTIQALFGAVTVVVAGERTPLAPGSFVVLDAAVPHAVQAEGSAPATVLVHHHRARAAGGAR